MKRIDLKLIHPGTGALVRRPDERLFRPAAAEAAPGSRLAAPPSGAPLALGRRGFVKGCVAIPALVVAGPLLTQACDPSTLLAFAFGFVKVLKDIFALAEDVKGTVQLVNNSDRAFRGDMLLELLEERYGRAVDEALGRVDVPPKSDPIYAFADLLGEDPGDHSVGAFVADADERSDVFQIVG